MDNKTAQLTIDSIQKWVWPHVDFGGTRKEKMCARFLGELNHEQGDVVELTFGTRENPAKRKGVFRLLEADLYRDDWMAQALPLAKEYWGKKRSEYRDDHTGEDEAWEAYKKAEFIVEGQDYGQGDVEDAFRYAYRLKSSGISVDSTKTS